MCRHSTKWRQLAIMTWMDDFKLSKRIKVRKMIVEVLDAESLDVLRYFLGSHAHTPVCCLHSDDWDALLV